MQNKVRSICCLACVTAVMSFAIVPNLHAQDRAAIEGFGGLALNSPQTAVKSPSLGGTMTLNVLPALQVVAEAGRLGNVLPTVPATALSLADVQVSAFYADAGLRLLAAPHSAVTPYVEGTLGISRLNVHSDRFSPLASAAATLALDVVGRNPLTMGAGGGLMLRGGPVLFDVGYRYKQLFADDITQFALGFGQPLRSHQARVGIGVRF